MRIDFRRRCAYCERPEPYLGGEDFFAVDHFRPSSKFPDLATHYPNLYYTCGKCNQYKGASWPKPNQLSEGLRFADPCEEDMYLEHLRESDDGYLETRTNCGLYTCGHVRLNRLDLLVWRRQLRQVAEDLERLQALRTNLAELLAFTTDPVQKTKFLEGIAAIELSVLRSRERFGL